MTSALERAEARFSWLKKRVKGRGDVWGVFPPHWHLPQLVALACCSITKAQLAEALSQVCARAFHVSDNAGTGWA